MQIIRERNILYAVTDGISLRLDVVRQQDAAGQPVVVGVHGGGWCTGTRQTLDVAANNLARAGFVAVNIDYRLAPQFPYPAACEDLRTAVAWVQQHIETYGGDGTRIGGFGFSAGGHLVSLLATREDTPLRCAVNWAGTMDFRRDAVFAPYLGYVLAFLGGCSHDLPTRYAEASPVTHLSPRSAPLLCIHGMCDDVVPPIQQKIAADAARLAGAPVECLPLAEAGHELGNPRQSVLYATTWQHIGEFFSRHLYEGMT